MQQQKITTPVEAPGLLALLLPTRGRPAACSRLLDSIEQTVNHHAQISVRCLVDSDDLETQEFVRRDQSKRRIKVEMYVAGPTRTQGERYNLLREKLHPYPEIYMPMADDVVCVTPGWDSLIFEAFRQCEDHILMCFPEDSTVGPDQATYTIIHAAWTNQIGRFATAMFPYWYEDVWMDEVGALVGRKKKLPFRMEAPEGKGKTQGMRNLPFWEWFFRTTITERRAEARALALHIYASSPTRYQEELAHIDARMQHLREAAPKKNLAELRAIENELTGVTPGSPPSRRYLECEALAAWRLAQEFVKASQGAEDKRLFEVLNNLSVALPEAMELSLEPAKA